MPRGLELCYLCVALGGAVVLAQGAGGQPAEKYRPVCPRTFAVLPVLEYAAEGGRCDPDGKLRRCQNEVVPGGGEEVRLRCWRDEVGMSCQRAGQRRLGEACWEAEQCNATEGFCLDGRCTGLHADGEWCTSHIMCLSGHCDEVLPAVHRCAPRPHGRCSLPSHCQSGVCEGGRCALRDGELCGGALGAVCAHPLVCLPLTPSRCALPTRGMGCRGVCSEGLVCGHNSTCHPPPRVCGSHADCLSGEGCNFAKCTKYASLPQGSLASSSVFCRPGLQLKALHGTQHCSSDVACLTDSQCTVLGVQHFAYCHCEGSAEGRCRLAGDFESCLTPSRSLADAACCVAQKATTHCTFSDGVRAGGGKLLAVRELPAPVWCNAACGKTAGCTQWEHRHPTHRCLLLGHHPANPIFTTQTAMEVTTSTFKEGCLPHTPYDITVPGMSSVCPNLFPPKVAPPVFITRPEHVPQPHIPFSISRLPTAPHSWTWRGDGPLASGDSNYSSTTLVLLPQHLPPGAVLAFHLKGPAGEHSDDTIIKVNAPPMLSGSPVVLDGQLEACLLGEDDDQPLTYRIYDVSGYLLYHTANCSAELLGHEGGDVVLCISDRFGAEACFDPVPSSPHPDRASYDVEEHLRDLLSEAAEDTRKWEVVAAVNHRKQPLASAGWVRWAAEGSAVTWDAWFVRHALRALERGGGGEEDVEVVLRMAVHPLEPEDGEVVLRMHPTSTTLLRSLPLHFLPDPWGRWSDGLALRTPSAILHHYFTPTRSARLAPDLVVEHATPFQTVLAVEDGGWGLQVLDRPPDTPQNPCPVSHPYVYTVPFVPRVTSPPPPIPNATHLLLTVNTAVVGVPEAIAALPARGYLHTTHAVGNEIVEVLLLLSQHDVPTVVDAVRGGGLCGGVVSVTPRMSYPLPVSEQDDYTPCFAIPQGVWSSNPSCGAAGCVVVQHTATALTCACTAQPISPLRGASVPALADDPTALATFHAMHRIPSHPLGAVVAGLVHAAIVVCFFAVLLVEWRRHRLAAESDDVEQWQGEAFRGFHGTTQCEERERSCTDIPMVAVPTVRNSSRSLSRYSLAHHSSFGSLADVSLSPDGWRFNHEVARQADLGEHARLPPPKRGQHGWTSLLTPYPEHFNPHQRVLCASSVASGVAVVLLSAFAECDATRGVPTLVLRYLFLSCVCSAASRAAYFALSQLFRHTPRLPPLKIAPPLADTVRFLVNPITPELSDEGEKARRDLTLRNEELERVVHYEIRCGRLHTAISVRILLDQDVAKGIAYVKGQAQLNGMTDFVEQYNREEREVLWCLARKALCMQHFQLAATLFHLALVASNPDLYSVFSTTPPPPTLHEAISSILHRNIVGRVWVEYFATTHLAIPRDDVYRLLLRSSTSVDVVMTLLGLSDKGYHDTHCNDQSPAVSSDCWSAGVQKLLRDNNGKQDVFGAVEAFCWAHRERCTYLQLNSAAICDAEETDAKLPRPRAYARLMAMYYCTTAPDIPSSGMAMAKLTDTEFCTLLREQETEMVKAGVVLDSGVAVELRRPFVPNPYLTYLVNWKTAAVHHLAGEIHVRSPLSAPSHSGQLAALCELCAVWEFKGSGSRWNRFVGLPTALQWARHGDRVILHGGWYPPMHISRVHGTPYLPVTILADTSSKESVLVTPQAATEEELRQGAGIVLEDCRFVAIQGIHVHGGDQMDGIDARDSVGVCTFDCSFSHVVRPLRQSPDDRWSNPPGSPPRCSPLWNVPGYLVTATLLVTTAYFTHAMAHGLSREVGVAWTILLLIALVQELTVNELLSRWWGCVRRCKWPHRFTEITELTTSEGGKAEHDGEGVREDNAEWSSRGSIPSCDTEEVEEGRRAEVEEGLRGGGSLFTSSNPRPTQQDHRQDPSSEDLVEEVCE